MSELKANKRDLKVKVSDLRQNAQIPCIYYGAGKTSSAISVDAKEFDKIYKLVGETGTLDLSIEGEGKLSALIHSVDYDPVKHTPIHIDFLIVDINKPIEVQIPIEFIGEAPAVKSNIGTLVKVMHEVAIKSLPKNIPHNITVDVSMLDSLESQIKVSDIKLDAGVEMITGGDEILAAIASIKEEVEETAPIDLSAIEVEKKGKKEDEPESAE